MPRHGRYPRPYLEIEFDREALTREHACCRYVPVVVRLCNVPEGARLTALFERVSKQDQDGKYLDDYEVHPRRPWDFHIHKEFPEYHEYHLRLLARPHDEETGLIHIKIESQSFTLLSEVVYRFDSRQQEPIRSSFHDGSFRGVRLVPFLRTTEERDALQGRYPAFVPRENQSASQTRVLVSVQQSIDSSSIKNWWLMER